MEDIQGFFDLHKTALMGPSTLPLPDKGKHLSLETDASVNEIGCSLMHVGDYKFHHTSGFWSRTLTPVEHNYKQHSERRLQ